MSDLPTEFVSVKEEESTLLLWTYLNKEYYFKDKLIKVLTDNKDDKLQYACFIDFIQYIISNDCWCVKVNDEILFNHFNFIEKSFSQCLLNKLFRHELIKDIHASLFGKLINGNKDAEIIIYMYGSDTWYYKINYDSENKTFRIDVS
jgi:hypothetical protein